MIAVTNRTINFVFFNDVVLNVLFNLRICVFLFSPIQDFEFLHIF